MNNSDLEYEILDLNDEILDANLSDEMNEELKKINEKYSSPQIKKITKEQLQGLGATFASIVELIPEEAIGLGAENGGLFRCVFPDGVAGKLAESGGKKLGGIIVEGGGFAQARWEPVVAETKDTGIVAAIANPEVILIAVAVIGIAFKMHELKKGQDKIIGILERDKKSQLIADYEILQDYLADYKYYYENAGTMTVNLNQVKNIKRNALKDVKSYHEELKNIVDEKNNILKMLAFNGEIKKVFDRFLHYRLAITVYSLSSYLEVMLSKNFQIDYLEKERQVMNSIGNDYNDIYISCSKKLTGIKKKSFVSKATNELSKLSKNAGNVIGKIPVLEKGPVDEALIAGSKKLKAFDEKSVNEMLEFFEQYKGCSAISIAEHIETLKQLANHKSEIVTDGNIIYLFSEKSA